MSAAVAPDIAGVKWDTKAGRYRYTDTKRFLSREAFLSITRRQIAYSENQLSNLNTKLINREITLRKWQTETAQLLKSLHVRQAILTKGGVDRMTDADYLRVGRSLRSEYKYLKGFAEDVKAGKLSEAQLRARSKLYLENSRGEIHRFEAVAAKEKGYQFMRRFLGRTDRHCADCLSYAALGVQRIGTIPLPTQDCACRARCKCRVEYS